MQNQLRPDWMSGVAINQDNTDRGYGEKIEDVGRVWAELPQVSCPLTHRFTPGMYIREIFMPKGTMVISRKHLTEHPFIVAKGHASVMTESGIEHFRAPYCGITKPGTQRVLNIHEDCVWITCHVTNETDPERITTLITEEPTFRPVARIDNGKPKEIENL